MIRSVDPLDQVIQYTYDPAGRLIEKRFENEERDTFTWDPSGNLIAFESPDIRVERTIDPDGRLAEEKSGGFSVQYEYDADGLRTGRTTSIGNRIRYAHDQDGLVSAVIINDQPPITFERNAGGQITAERLSRSLARSYGYDEEGRLVRQRIAGPTQQIERRFEYDAVGNLTARHDSHKGTWRFDHDPLGRIIGSIDPLERVNRYLHDPAGDLLQHLPEPQNGLRSAVYENTIYRFDAAGNLVERETGSQDLSARQTTHFEWDPNNRLRIARTPADQTIRMAYDALGRRTRKSVNGERTFFAWDGDTLLAERFEDQGYREYLYHPGTFEPLAAIEPDGRILFYHNDINGLPQELTTPDGTLVWSAAYDALGRLDRLLVDEAHQPLRLQGQYFDAELDLCYNRHRYFDPRICSFVSQDPIGLAGGENVYAYAPNVWGWVDPLGLSCSMTPPKTALPDDVIRLAEQNITDSGVTVLGSWRAKPGKLNYIGKAKVKNASYFDVGSAWDDLVDRKLNWEANKHFLDVVTSKGDNILLSIPKTEVTPGTYLAEEIKYLVEMKHYKWVNQWKLVAP